MPFLRVLAGFAGLRLDPDDWMGSIYIIAASPDQQRKGISKALTLHADDKIGEFGATMIMIGTIGDSGHEVARPAYEAFAFERWPVAPY
ncbi:MAG: GNAT family N-acetyltransferase [Maritimibacter sp.]